jgi:hypothetical protein
MNYIPLGSYSRFEIPVKTAFFSPLHQENYIVSSSPVQSSSPEQSTSPVQSTSTSSPYTEKYINDQYNSKKGYRQWTVSQKSPAKQVTSIAIQK